jgi:hypothetical protein
MEEKEMDRNLTTLALAIGMLGIGGARASARDHDQCSDGTLRGAYAFTLAGQILNGDGSITTRNGVAMTTFDGKGGLTQVDYVMSLTPASSLPFAPGGTDPNPVFRTDETGSYSVNADCTGTAEIDVAPDTSKGFVLGQVIKLVFVLDNHGLAIHTVVSEVFPPSKTTTPPSAALAVIHSDGWRVGSIRDGVGPR